MAFCCILNSASKWMSTCFTLAAADRYFIRPNCLVSMQPWSCGLIISSIMQGAVCAWQAQLRPFSNKAPRRPKGWARGRVGCLRGLGAGGGRGGGHGWREVCYQKKKKKKSRPGQFIHSKWRPAMRRDEHFWNVTKLRALMLWLCVYCAECKSNSTSVHWKVCLAPIKKRKGRKEGEKNHRYIQNWIYNAHARHCLANLDNLELMAIKVTFVLEQGWVWGGVQSNGNHDKWHLLSESHFPSLDWFVISTFDIFHPSIKSQWQSDIF